MPVTFDNDLPVVQSNLAYSVLEKYLVRHESSKEPTKHLIMRISMIATSALIAYLGTLPDVALAIDWARGDPDYATVLVLSHTWVLTTIYLWALSRIIKNDLSYFTEEEKKLFKEVSRKRCLESSIKAAAVATALVFKSPMAFKAYVNNPVFSYFFAICTFLTFPIPAFSIALGTHHLGIKATHFGPYKELYAVKKELHQLHKDNIYYLCASGDEDESDYIKALNAAENVDAVLTHFERHRNAAIPSSELSRKIPAYALGAAFSFSLLALIFMMSYDAGLSLVDNTVFAIFCGLGISVCSLYLLMTKTARAVDNKFKDIAYLVKKRKLFPTPATKCHSKITFGIKLVLHLPLPLAYGPIFQASQNAFPTYLAPYIDATAFASILLIVSEVLCRVGEVLSEEFSKRFGSDRDKQFLSAVSKIRYSDFVFLEMSHRAFANALKRIPEELFASWTAKSGLTKDKLESYLTSATKPHLPSRGRLVG